MKNKKDLNTWIDWLLSQPVESAEINFPKRIEAAKRLGLVNLPSYVIVVSGTNGKGSVITLLERLFVLNHISVGTITSPHLINFNERIRINEQSVTDELIGDAFATIHNKTNDLNLGYHTYTALAGLLILKNQSLDVIIIEVGVGGRLDSANTIQNNLTVITNVDLDHCNLLGDTREKIAAEKAGLIQKNTIVICGDESCPAAIITAAKKKNAKLYRLNQDYFIEENNSDWSWKNDADSLNHLPKPNMLLQNAATALQVFDEYSRKRKTKGSMLSLAQKALKSAYNPGRCDLWQDQCTILLDVAHNPQAVENLMRYAKPLVNKADKVFAICGMNKNKNIELCIKKMAPLIDEWHIAPTMSEDNQSMALLEAVFLRLGIHQYSCYPDAFTAYNDVCKRVHKVDLIVIFGSFLIVGPVLGHLRQAQKQEIKSGSSIKA